MDSDKKNPKEQPFFTQFLEDQAVENARGGADGQTNKWPSDFDEETLKYPSDRDEVRF